MGSEMCIRDRGINALLYIMNQMRPVAKRNNSCKLKARDLAILEFKISEFNDTEWCILCLKGHGTQKPSVKALNLNCQR